MPVRAWQKIAQAFMPGFLIFNGIESRRDKRDVSSSPRDLLPDPYSPSVKTLGYFHSWAKPASVFAQATW
jgi:hypothetical protein